MNLNPKREVSESYEDYKVRQREIKKYEKFKLQGEIVWESKTDGTYIKKIHRNKKRPKTSNRI